jgi:hypothetical protein
MSDTIRELKTSLGEKRKRLETMFDFAHECHSQEEFVAKFLKPLQDELTQAEQELGVRLQNYQDHVAVYMEYEAYYSQKKVCFLEVFRKAEFDELTRRNPEFHLGSLDGKHSSCSATFTELIKRRADTPAAICNLLDEFDDNDEMDCLSSYQCGDYDSYSEFLGADSDEEQTEDESE